MANFEIAKPTKLPPDSPVLCQKYAFLSKLKTNRRPLKRNPKSQRLKKKYRLANWPEYNKALINRGFITLWLHEDTLAQWYYQGPRTPGGLFRYSEQCIQTALALKAVFQLAFRQTQGLIQSLLEAMKMDLNVPSYTQPLRRPGLSPTSYLGSLFGSSSYQCPPRSHSFSDRQYGPKRVR